MRIEAMDNRRHARSIAMRLNRVAARWCRMRWPFLLLLPFTVTATAQKPDTNLAPPSSAEHFFQGRTESRGELRQLFSQPHLVVAHGLGRIERDGTLVLNQTVEETGVAPKQREWRLREDRLGHCTGTVTDGVGLVEGDISRSRLHLVFRLKGGLKVEQWLSLYPDGLSARNYLTIRKFGFQVASLDETIRKTD
jgi:hypothetical protein